MSTEGDRGVKGVVRREHTITFDSLSWYEINHKTQSVSGTIVSTSIKNCFINSKTKPP